MLRLTKSGSIIISLLIIPALLFSQEKSFLTVTVQPGIDSAINIQWTAEAGADTFSFLVEKSTDKLNWEKIVGVNPQSSHQYTVTDNQPGKGLIYYRVDQVNNNIHKILTQTRWVQINEAGKLYIWPNPVKNTLFVKASFDNGIMEIINSGGKVIAKIIIYNYITEVPASDLSKGFYFIRVIHNNDQLIERFVKN